MGKKIDFEELARSVLFARTSQELADTLNRAQVQFRKGKAPSDIMKARSDTIALKNGHGISEMEISFMEGRLQDIFKQAPRPDQNPENTNNAKKKKNKLGR